MQNQITIGNNVFTVNPLLGEQSFLLQPKLAPALAEIIALYSHFMSTVMGLSEGGTNDEVDVMQLLPKAIPALAEAGIIVDRLCVKLGPNLKEILRTLLMGATMDGVPLFTPQGNPFDVKMQGRTMDTWRLLIYAIEVSYPDFFGLVRGLRGKTSHKDESSAKSNTSQPGPVSV